MATLSGRWGAAHTIKLNSSVEDSTVFMADPTFNSAASMTDPSAVGDAAGARFDQIERSHLEEVRNAVDVFELQFLALTIQEAGDP